MTPEPPDAPAAATPDAGPPELRIVHLDDDLAVIDKPAGLVVHPAPSHTGPTLVSELGDLLGGGDPERPGIVHRLDKDTSGLMVVARGPEALVALQEEVREREVERRYLALAGGRLASRTGTIDAPIGRATKRRTRMAVAGAASREARTHFEVLELLPRESYLEARLETGRTHQIRAHFAAIGHPLTGDSTYGGALRYGLRRQFLHSHRLAFRHPTSGARLEFSSPLPADLRPPWRRPTPSSARLYNRSSLSQLPRPKADRILPGSQIPGLASGAGSRQTESRRTHA